MPCYIPDVPPNVKTKTVRRSVIVSKRNPKGKATGRPRFWAFGYPDLADLFGVDEKTVRNWVANKDPAKGTSLDPSNLEALCKAWLKRHTGSP